MLCILSLFFNKLYFKHKLTTKNIVFSIFLTLTITILKLDFKNHLVLTLLNINTISDLEDKNVYSIFNYLIILILIISNFNKLTIDNLLIILFYLLFYQLNKNNIGFGDIETFIALSFNFDFKNNLLLFFISFIVSLPIIFFKYKKDHNIAFIIYITISYLIMLIYLKV